MNTKCTVHSRAQSVRAREGQRNKFSNTKLNNEAEEKQFNVIHIRDREAERRILVITRACRPNRFHSVSLAISRGLIAERKGNEIVVNALVCVYTYYLCEFE